MTNYEFIQNAEINDVAKYLCFMISTASLDDDCAEGCDGCFANEYCFIGNNGIQKWLEEEYRGMEVPFI